MTGFDLSTIQNCYIGGTAASAIYYGSTKIWPTAYDYSQDYFTIESLADNNDILFEDRGDQDPYNVWYDIYYSLDEGVTWTSYTPGVTGTYITLNNGDKMLIKSTVSKIYYNINASKTFKVYGNLHSLIYGDEFKHIDSLPSEFQLHSPSIFVASKIVDASDLILPATTLIDWCYEDMFQNCTSLTAAPKLHATTLATACYDGMFYGCTSLTTGPVLPATTLAEHCYAGMFEGCTNLNSITCLATDISASACTVNWLNGVSATGSFYKNSTMTNWTRGTAGIPTGWAVYDIAT